MILSPDTAVTFPYNIQMRRKCSECPVSTKQAPLVNGKTPSNSRTVLFKKQVSFGDQDTIKHVEHFSEYSIKEKEMLWYTESFHKSKLRDAKERIKFEKENEGLPQNVLESAWQSLRLGSEGEENMRGLEKCQSLSIYRSNKFHRQCVIRSVLDVQEYQREFGFYSDKQIMMTSHRLSKHSESKAKRLGACDEVDAMKIYSEESCLQL